MENESDKIDLGRIVGGSDARARFLIIDSIQAHVYKQARSGKMKQMADQMILHFQTHDEVTILGKNVDVTHWTDIFTAAQIYTHSLPVHDSAYDRNMEKIKNYNPKIIGYKFIREFTIPKSDTP